MKNPSSGRFQRISELIDLDFTDKHGNHLFADLYDEDITEVPEYIRNYKHLRILFIDNHGLEFLPNWLSELPLIALNVSKSNIATIPEIPTLEHLEANDNHNITKFKAPPNLTHLEMHNCDNLGELTLSDKITQFAVSSNVLQHINNIPPDSQLQFRDTTVTPHSWDYYAQNDIRRRVIQNSADLDRDSMSVVLNYYNYSKEANSSA